MKDTQKAMLFCITILLAILTSTVQVHACRGALDPNQHAEKDDDSNKTEGSKPDSDGTDTMPRAGQVVEDPVLLNTGEFLFTRTDAVIPGPNLDF